MKCEHCKCEMAIDKVIDRQGENKMDIVYKCRNKGCTEYGFKRDFVESLQKFSK
ncbi:MAG: hypothetical protein RR806_05325 [Oscillospiraceae bacterium]